MNAAIKKLGLPYDINIIGNPRLFHEYDANTSPTLIIDGNILVEGYVPRLEDMINILTRIANIDSM